MRGNFGKLVTAMVSPFDAKLNLDLKKAEALARLLVEEGTQGIVVAGTTGESPTLTDEEKLELFRCVVDAVGGSVPVIGGTGCNSTSKTIKFTRKAAKTGIDAALLVVPYYNRPSQKGLVEHFTAVAKATELACILYNVPSRTGRNMTAETTLRLAEIPNIVGVKEASGDLVQIAEICACKPDDFVVYSGNDSDTLHVLLLGGQGVISVMSHIAGPSIRKMIELFQNGEVEKARELHFQLLPLAQVLFPPFSPNPVPVKTALKMRGFDAGSVRPPLTEIKNPSWFETAKQLVAMFAPSML